MSMDRVGMGVSVEITWLVLGPHHQLSPLTFAPPKHAMREALTDQTPLQHACARFLVGKT